VSELHRSARQMISILLEASCGDSSRRSFLGFVALCFAATLCGGCFPNIAGDTHVEVLSRVTSPRGEVDAVVELVSGGASVSSSYIVYVGPAGFSLEAKRDRDSFRMGSLDSAVTDGERGLRVTWISDTDVQVRCSSHRGFRESRNTVSISGRSFVVKWQTE
jgi:hypothetical protein